MEFIVLLIMGIMGLGAIYVVFLVIAGIFGVIEGIIALLLEAFGTIIKMLVIVMRGLLYPFMWRSTTLSEKLYTLIVIVLLIIEFWLDFDAIIIVTLSCSSGIKWLLYRYTPIFMNFSSFLALSTGESIQKIYFDENSFNRLATRIKNMSSEDTQREVQKIVETAVQNINELKKLYKTYRTLSYQEQVRFFVLLGQIVKNRYQESRKFYTRLEEIYFHLLKQNAQITTTSQQLTKENETLRNQKQLFKNI